ncbi:OLC1v1031854C1 [Oldenlandia corymbosa var. corymbosa]|uniref:OLC1v1031854C1 n=1 Tax=Oldenlandia corymbosa var. corymbosa TaxID=529605 RepID=A0AAV1CMQ2_OLDCO|nr:OLC1v1031854C1 [Oldenlandia corymbosa var. corymbosa]
MGGHGGLNILPQKRWNVYNFDNREKVRRDEEAAAKEEQLHREQAAKREAEFRLEKLRQARGLSKPSTSKPEPQSQPAEHEPDQPREADSKHMNLFEGIRIFDPIFESKDQSKVKRNDSKKRVKKEEPVRVITAEDEKYRLGYGVAGKGVKLPWYMSRPAGNSADDEKNGADEDDYYNGELEFGKRKNKHSSDDGGIKKKQKKSLEELREERLERERKERERERALKGEKSKPRRDGAYSGYGYGHSSRR